MKRRDFLKTSLAASTIVGLGSSAERTSLAASAQPAAKQEYYELRVYRLKAGASSDLIDAYLEKAAIPALNRLGIKPVGVFKEIDPKEALSVFVLIPFASPDALAETAARVGTDPEYVQAAGAYLQTPKANPAYERIDSWLMRAFAGQPKIALPAYSTAKQARMFELRTYESHNEAKALKKVEMFNSGEIETMHEVGLAPIFYGQALVGPNLPHLTYMTSGADQKVHQSHWDAFGKHPTWVKLKDDPQYADTVSKITKWFLAPTAYSQI